MSKSSNQSPGNNNNYDAESSIRPSGSAGAASLDALAFAPLTGAGSGGTVAGSGSQIAESALSKDEADRLYEENIEDEYAKREGGA
jgi:hypothetical protein